MGKEIKRNGGQETRDFPLGRIRRTFEIELRQEGEDEDRKIVGYAAKFDRESQPLGWFTEVIRPGAFAPALQDSDVRALWNHNDDWVLGRTSAGTLTLREDEVGLWIEIDPPGTQWARDLMHSIERGDVTQMSFAFGDVTDRRTDDGETVLRELLEIRKLYDVSPVTYPAYEDTEVYLRKIASGEELTEAERAVLRERYGDSRSESDPSPNSESEAGDAGADDTVDVPAGANGSEEELESDESVLAGRSAEFRRRELELAGLK